MKILCNHGQDVVNIIKSYSCLRVLPHGPGKQNN